MRLNSIQLLNYRCFSDITVRFDADFNVLAGANGSGKTTLLKGISESLAALVGYLPNTQALMSLNDESDVRFEMVEQQGRFRFERRYPVVIRARAVAFGEEMQWELTKKNALAYAEILGRLPGTAALEKSGSIPTLGSPSRISDFTLPVAAFYRANRHWNSREISEVAAATARNSRMDAYANWQDSSFDAGALLTWVISKSLERAQSSAQSGKKFDEIEDDELALVNSALSAALEGAKGLYYDLLQKSLMVRWERAAAAGVPETPFANLSDGQRAIVGLVVDIARRMCLLNPHLGAQVIRETPGIVLIDELDIHLHPKWQRAITRGLRAAFPCVQFIAASHSPQILSELQPTEIIVLEPGATSHPEASYGLDSSSILEEVMMAKSRPAEIAALLETIYDSLERNDIAAARRDSATLASKSPQLPELQRIAALVTRKETIGR